MSCRANCGGGTFLKPESAALRQGGVGECSASWSSAFLILEAATRSESRHEPRFGALVELSSDEFMDRRDVLVTQGAIIPDSFRGNTFSEQRFSISDCRSSDCRSGAYCHLNHTLPFLKTIIRRCCVLPAVRRVASLILDRPNRRP